MAKRSESLVTLGDLVRERNADRMTDAVSKGVSGAAFTIGTVFAVLLGSWFVSLVATTTISRAGWLALGVTAVYLAGAFCAAWLMVAPLTEVVPPSVRAAAARDSLATIFPGGADRYESAFRREPIGGVRAIVLAGPLALVEALAARKDLIREDPALVENAQKLLEELSEGALASDSVVDRDAIVLLVRLGVVKTKRHAEDEVTISLNAKGKALVPDAA